jgi:hypothetical protein
MKPLSNKRKNKNQFLIVLNKSIANLKLAYDWSKKMFFRLKESLDTPQNRIRLQKIWNKLFKSEKTKVEVPTKIKHNRPMRKKKPKTSKHDKELMVAIQRHLDYLLAEGIIVADGKDSNGEVLYRRKTEEEIAAEIEEIENL